MHHADGVFSSNPLTVLIVWKNPFGVDELLTEKPAGWKLTQSQILSKDSDIFREELVINENG